MTDKCKKYEAIFVFQDEESLEKHMETCEDCRNEHALMQKVSDLLQEAKPLYFERKTNYNVLKTACAIFLLLICGTTFGMYSQNPFIIDEIVYGEPTSLEELGFPVDSYGLLMVDDEV